MKDRELIELAGKAVGRTIEWHQEMSGDFPCYKTDGGYIVWNPLINPADTLQLAVALELDIRQLSGTTAVFYHQTHLASEHHGCPLQRTCRAVVRAAVAKYLEWKNG